MNNKELLMSLLGTFTVERNPSTNLRIDERDKIKDVLFLENRLPLKEIFSFGCNDQYYAILYCSSEKGNECVCGDIIFDYGRLYYLLIPYNPSVKHGDFGLCRYHVRSSIYYFIKNYLSSLTNNITFGSEPFSILLYYCMMQKLTFYPGNDATLSDEYFLQGEILARCAHLGIPDIESIIGYNGEKLIDNITRNGGDTVHKLNRLLTKERTSCINIISAEFIDGEVYTDPRSKLEEYSYNNFIIVDAKEYKEPIPFVAKILSIIKESSDGTIIIIAIDGYEGEVLSNTIAGMTRHHAKIERNLSGLLFTLYGTGNINSYNNDTIFTVPCDVSNYLVEIRNFINGNSRFDV